MGQRYENDIAVFAISDGVFVLRVKRGTCLNLHTAQLIINIRLGMQHNKPSPALYNFDGFIDSDKPGRDFLSKHISALSTTVAICASRHVPKIIAGFILSVSKPSVPCALFIDEAAALAAISTLP